MAIHDDLGAQLGRSVESRALCEGSTVEQREAWANTTARLRERYRDECARLADDYDSAPAWPRMWYAIRVQQATIEYLCQARVHRAGLSFVDRAIWRRLDSAYVVQPWEILGADDE